MIRNAIKTIVFLSLVCFICGCAPKSRKKIIITFAGGGVGVEEQVTREQIASFQEAYPNIEVKYKVMPNSATQRHDIYVTHLSAQDSSIDVYMIDIIWPAEFAAAGWILPFDEYIDSTKRKEFLQSPLKGCTYKGKLYAIPWFTTGGLIYYRKDLLEAEGLKPPATWSELVSQAKLLSSKYNIDGLLWQGAQYEGLICDFLEFVWSNGGELINDKGEVVINSPEAIQALQFMVDTIYEYKISPEGVTTYMEEETRHIFQDGGAVFLRNWPYVWALLQGPTSKVKGKVGVSLIPKGPEGERGIGCVGGWNLAISKFSKHPEQAWKFIEFVTSYEKQTYRAIKAGQAPSLKSAYDDKRVLEANPFYIDLRKAIQNSKARPQTPFYSEISEILQIYVSKALTKSLSPKDALNQAKIEIENILSKAKR